MTTYTIANAFRPELDSAVDGLTVEAYKVSTWSGAHNPPHLGDSPPGSPAVSGTTSTNFGNHGAWELALPTNEDYFVVVEYSSSYYWSRYNLPAFTDGEIGEVDTGAMTIAEVVAGGLYTDPDLAYIQPVGATSSGSVSDGAVIHGAFIDHQHAGLGQSLQLTGATEPTRYAGATTIGAPSSGTFDEGDFVLDYTGALWICTTAGSPGTWKKVGPALTILSHAGMPISTDGAFVAGSQALDTAENLWVCTVGGTPGTWVPAQSSAYTYRVYQATTQSLPNATGETLKFDTVDFTTKTWGTAPSLNGTGYITVNDIGVYEVTSQFFVGSSGAGAAQELDIYAYVNFGSGFGLYALVYDVFIGAAGNQYNSVRLSFKVQFTSTPPTNTFAINVVQLNSNGATEDTAEPWSFCEVRYLGPN